VSETTSSKDANRAALRRLLEQTRRSNSDAVTAARSSQTRAYRRADGVAKGTIDPLSR
jgi:hypothetical protein